jgi:hypothetical protein
MNVFLDIILTDSPKIVTSIDILHKLSFTFFTRLIIDLLSVFVLIRLIYYANYKKSDLFLSFFGFNIIIFLITFLLNQVNMSIGAAFGLFAVFSILRFRTEGISTKDMTYLFLTIAMGLISAVSVGQWYEIVILNVIILLVVKIIESGWLMKSEVSKRLIYDQPTMLSPIKKSELLADITLKTGLPVHRTEIIEIDLIKDSAILQIFYFEKA